MADVLRIHGDPGLFATAVIVEWSFEARSLITEHHILRVPLVAKIP